MATAMIRVRAIDVSVVFATTLSFFLVLCVTAQLVHATTPTVSIPNQQAGEEGTITLPITLAGFMNLNSMTITLRWDPTVVVVTGIDEGNLGGLFLSGKPQIENPVTIAWIKATPPLISDGVFAYVTVSPVRSGATVLDVNLITASVFGQTEGNIVITDEVAVSSSIVTIIASETDLGDSIGAQDSAGSDLHVSKYPDGGSPARNETTTTPSGNTAGLTIRPAQVLPNQETAISAIICNFGAEPTSKSILLKVDGQIDQTHTLSIGAGDCKEVVFTTARGQPGTYQVAVDNMVGEFTVLPAMPVPPPPPGGEVVPLAGQEGISAATILAIVGAMLVLIAALVFFFRSE